MKPLPDESKWSDVQFAPILPLLSSRGLDILEHIGEDELMMEQGFQEPSDVDVRNAIKTCPALRMTPIRPLKRRRFVSTILTIGLK